MSACEPAGTAITRRTRSLSFSLVSFVASPLLRRRDAHILTVLPKHQKGELMDTFNAFLMPYSFLRRWTYTELIPALLYFDRVTFLMDDIEPQYLSGRLK